MDTLEEQKDLEEKVNNENSNMDNIKDELSEIIFVKNPKIFVVEWLPFDSNQLRELNKKMDIEKGFHKTLLTGLIDESPDVPIFRSRGAHTKVFVEDYELDSYVNMQAMIDLPEEEGIVQIEEMAILVSRIGFVVYSLELKEINQQNTFMSLDKLTRVIADLSQDSSVVIDSLLTEFQRNFIDIIFGNPIHRPKIICIVGEDIKPRHDDINDYYDGEDFEIELAQVLGEGHKAFQEGRNLHFKGERGTIAIVEDFGEEHEYEIVFWGIQHAINSFVDSFMSRIWELYDQARHIKELIDEAVTGNTDALNQVQEEISILTSIISLIGQIQEFLKNSSSDLLEIYNSNEKTHLNNFYEIENLLKSAYRRTVESEKILDGLQTEMEGLRNYISTLSELQMRRMSKVMTKNTKSMNQVLHANTRTSEAIDMIELILAGSIILEVFAFAVGEIQSSQTFFDVLTGLFTGNHIEWTAVTTTTLIMFIVSIAFWVLMVIYLRRSKKRMEMDALRDLVVTLSINQKIDSAKFEEFMNQRKVLTKYIEKEHGNVIISYEWDACKDPIFEGCNIEKVYLSYNQTNSLLISIEIETSDLQANQDMLLQKIIDKLEEDKILL